ncbi:MAG: 2,3-bisphosphoglycerate-independent phosphoglycerate mutase [Candidatus Limnocylindrales bacterium]
MPAAVSPPRPLILVILDGFGIGRHPERDAIAAARMPTWRKCLAEWPHARLEASGPAVGLPRGQMGNSEVGHLNLGAGRPVLQDLPRIDAAIADGTLDANAVLLDTLMEASRPGRRLHLLSLIGPGGVHANDRHLVALAALAARLDIADVVVHAMLDGRDTPPRSADGHLADLIVRLAAAHPGARIGTLGGRYFGMDRDKRWERTAQAYQAIVHGRGLSVPSVTDAIAGGYRRGEDDEFVTPTVVEGVEGAVRPGDVVIHCNFRADRARQLTHALVDGADFTGFERGHRPAGTLVSTMTRYQEDLPVRVLFPPTIARSLAQAFSELSRRQFHVAETEKYAHVTYFLNGGVEAAWPGEERMLVPSPKVATYDLAPEMSAAGVTDGLVAAIEGGEYDFIVANYANPDMVGHTGDWAATVRAIEAVDGCLSRVVEAVSASTDALLCATADHGNADEMRDAAGHPVTAHSLAPVPVLMMGRAVAGRHLRDGVLADLAPTVLELLGLPAWEGMTGHSLLTAFDDG